MLLPICDRIDHGRSPSNFTFRVNKDGYNKGSPGFATDIIGFADKPSEVIVRYPLSISSSDGTGSGSGTVISNPSGIDCGTDCSARIRRRHLSHPDRGNPAGGSTFSGWSGGGCSGTGQCTVTMDQARDSDCHLCSRSAAATGLYPDGHQSRHRQRHGYLCRRPGLTAERIVRKITLNGTPGHIDCQSHQRFDFSGWSGGGCSGTGPCTVTMDQARDSDCHLCSHAAADAGLYPVGHQVRHRQRNGYFLVPAGHQLRSGLHARLR
jgi:hypothetical protein